MSASAPSPFRRAGPEPVTENQATPSQSSAGRRDSGSLVLAYLLIFGGVYLFLVTQFTLAASTILVVIGAAFLVARITTGNYGFAVPAGILIGLGAFVTLNEAGTLTGNSGAWAVILLGAGFLLVYPFGARWSMYWPVIPGAILLLVGIAMLDATALAPLATYVGIARYWPVALVAIGVWILGRESLPPSIRPAVGGAVLIALVALGALALAVAVATGTVGGDLNYAPTTTLPAWSGTTSNQATSLSAPMPTDGTLQITNETGGSVEVLAGAGTQVQVQIIRAPSFGSTPAISLVPVGNDLVLQARHTGGPFQSTAPVNFVVTAPATLPLSVETPSGNIRVLNRQAAVTARASSGSVDISYIGGPLDVQTASGSIHVTNVTGDARLGTSSGSIAATGLAHPRWAQSSSGGITLAGTFADNTTVQSSSGSISLQLAPNSSTNLDINTSSGSISLQGLTLTSRDQSVHHLAGTIGTGTGSLAVTTSSGSVQISSAR